MVAAFPIFSLLFISSCHVDMCLFQVLELCHIYKSFRLLFALKTAYNFLEVLGFTDLNLNVRSEVFMMMKIHALFFWVVTSCTFTASQPRRP
jgi:hypothetical protein